MVKDYFQDITPPEHSDPEQQEIPIRVNEEPVAPRGIRSIPAPSRRLPPRSMSPGGYSEDEHEHAPVSKRFSHLALWAVAGLALLLLVALGLLMLRPTTVNVVAKTHSMTLTDTILFTAAPAESAQPGALTYTVQTTDLEDSEVVAAQGMTHAERKASGSITVYNEFSATSVRLIKNTRFESTGGLVFRTPADIVIPGKSAAGPGQIQITVVADQPGENYNIGPEKFSLPGLKSGEMYTKVYAKSTAVMQGGFVGEEPGTAPGALNTAIAAVRARLEAKARESARAQASDQSVVLPDLIQVSYQSLPSTIEAGAGVRIHEKAHIIFPVFPADTLASVVAQSAAADADNAPITLIPGDNFAARVPAGITTNLGVDPLKFVLVGNVKFVWKVDAAALAQALVGRDGAAFQSIVNGFSGIQEAHAKIEPFWKSTFPAKASDIKVTVSNP